MKLGKLGFWIIASKLPDEFMEFAKKNDHIWVISNSTIEEIGSEYVGPLRFVAFGNIYTLYGLIGEYEKSQSEFIAIYGDQIPKQDFPFPSLLSLMYPILAMASFPDPSRGVIEIMGYGFSNLGYLLFAALIPGTFRIFGMERRMPIFLGAFIFFIFGVFLVNV